MSASLAGSITAVIYPMLTGNGIKYGLDGEATGYQTEYGWAFAGIVDGDWTWAVDVLAGGRTAMAPGKASYRVIDRSVDQRLEKHALLADVSYWPHQNLTVTTDPGALPTIATEHLPVAGLLQQSAVARGRPSAYVPDRH
ncbi:hypothetical protein NLX85_17180 [Micromonospora sp. A3M-1-15]|nr:hypothetical protein [Micromonospora sp. A3M-1-15]